MGRFLACPRCKTINRGEGWTIDAKETYSERVIGIDEFTNDLDEAISTEKVFGSESYEIVGVMHDCGFYTEAYNLGDFLIEVHDGRITAVGSYWEEHEDELRELARAHGLKVAL